MQTVALIDYGAGNIPSAERALQVAAEMSNISTRVIVTSDPDIAASADRVVIPGVGHFRDCRKGIDSVPGLVETLKVFATDKARPVLGICVGMQLMADIGMEDGVTEGLGWIPGKVVEIPGVDRLPIPHMGWNELEICGTHPVMDGISNGNHAYFVHSYHFEVAEPSDLMMQTQYGQPITAAIGRGSVFGVQFHPELSQTTGLRLLANWIKWRP